VGDSRWALVPNQILQTVDGFGVFKKTINTVSTMAIGSNKRDRRCLFDDVVVGVSSANTSLFDIVVVVIITV
jgi:hypothetical protein